MMKSALVTAVGQAPSYADFVEPLAGDGEVIVAVTAAALSPLARARASGRHYSSAAHLPFIAGVDGAGRLADGRPVYFVLPRAPFGAMAERSVVDATRVLPLPAGLDPVTAAAVANPGMSSWAALIERARLVAGETVLVNGATGASGRLAVDIARLLGARKVIATGRNAAILAATGADVVIPLTGDGDALEAALAPHIAAGIDVVVDYLWGPSAERLLKTAAGAAGTSPLRFVQVGTASGADIVLPGAILRASSIVLLGSGIGSVPLPRLLAAVAGVLDAAAAGRLAIEATAVPLSDVGEAWDRNDGRTVFTVP